MLLSESQDILMQGKDSVVTTAQCTSCLRPVPVSDLHNSCLKCLEEVHVKDQRWICRDFKHRMKKDREVRLKFLLMEAALGPSLEMSPSDLVSSAAASVRSTPQALAESLQHSSLRIPRKKYKTSREEAVATINLVRGARSS